MKKKTIAMLVIAAACLAMTGCHKRCACTSYNGMIYYYTPDEVDAKGTTCPGMVMQANTRYYSLCEWE